MKKLMVGYTLIMGLVGWYGMAAQASDLEENGYWGCTLLMKQWKKRTITTPLMKRCILLSTWMRIRGLCTRYSQFALVFDLWYNRDYLTGANLWLL